MTQEAFLRETGEVCLTIPAPPRLTLEQIQSRWGWVKRIEKDNSPKGPVALTLATVLKDGESKISGSEYELRLTPNQSVLLGLSQAVWLEEHQAEFPTLMALLGKVHIDFPATIVRGDVDERRFPYFYGVGWRFALRWDWADNDFHSNVLYAALPAFFKCRGNKVGTHSDEGQVYNSRNVFHRRKRLLAQNLFLSQINRKNLAILSGL